MGRDTGIILRSDAIIPFWVRVNRNKLREQRKSEGPYSIEICYWRNKHRLASRISDGFGMFERDYADYEMTETDAKLVMDAVWDQFRYGQEYNLYERLRLVQDYINLAWLYHLLKARPVEVIYYDSF